MYQQPQPSSCLNLREDKKGITKGGIASTSCFQNIKHRKLSFSMFNLHKSLRLSLTEILLFIRTSILSSLHLTKLCFIVMPPEDHQKIENSTLVIFRIQLLSQHPSNCIGTLLSINGRRGNSSSITGTFTTREQPSYMHMLQR